MRERVSLALFFLCFLAFCNSRAATYLPVALCILLPEHENKTGNFGILFSPCKTPVIPYVDVVLITFISIYFNLLSFLLRVYTLCRCMHAHAAMQTGG